jgi:hypothetical protein
MTTSDTDNKSISISKRILFDNNTEVNILKFITGSILSTITKDLKSANISNEQKASLARLTVVIAIGYDGYLAKTFKSDLLVVVSLPFIILNGALDIEKLSVIGHCLMRYNITGRIGKAWRLKLNGFKSIYETTDYSNFPTRTAESFEKQRAQVLFIKDLADVLYKLVVPSELIHYDQVI